VKPVVICSLFLHRLVLRSELIDNRAGPRKSTMSTNIHRVIEQHEVYYEVLPYYEIVEERKPGTAPITRKIQAGFDINVYGIKADYELTPGPDYALFQGALQNLVERALPQNSEDYSVEVIPFPSTIIATRKRGFQNEGMLRIRIMHIGMGQSAGAPEERALTKIKQGLHDLGLQQR
jgi:hypothetical protein